MSGQRVASQRTDASAVLHPDYVRVRLESLLDAERQSSDERELFERLRAQTQTASASIGVAHEGAKGRFVHRLKGTIQRALYWYVDPAFTTLRTTSLALIDTTESLSIEVARLRDELGVLQRNYEREADARRRAVEHSGTRGQ